MRTRTAAGIIGIAAVVAATWMGITPGGQSGPQTITDQTAPALVEAWHAGDRGIVAECQSEYLTGRAPANCIYPPATVHGANGRSAESYEVYTQDGTRVTVWVDDQGHVMSPDKADAFLTTPLP